MIEFHLVALNNGGGAFLIPYIIVLFVVAKPIYFLEMCVGQFCSKGHCKMWQMVPFFKGVGYGATFGTACLLSFYAVLIAITVQYFVYSFWPILPWDNCDTNLTYAKFCDHIPNDTETEMLDAGGKTCPEIFFSQCVYKEIDNIDQGLGIPNWEIVLCLLLSWIVIFGTLIKGVQSSGKVAYFTALFPYVVLIIFLIRGLTLKNSWAGVVYFFTPKWEKLKEPKVWVEAVTQCFFSMSIAFGPVVTFSSFNKFSHNIYKDAMIVSFMDTFTSLLAGTTTFSVLGYLADKSNTTIDTVAKGGPALVFVSFPAAIASFDIVPNLFSILFFLMFFTLGIGSAVSLAGGIATVINDKFPKIHKQLVACGVCISGFLIGIVYTTPGGQWILKLVDYFGAGSIVYMIGMLEMVGIIYVYGLRNIVRDIEFMLNRKISWYWQVCWVLIPIILFVVLVLSLVFDKGLTYDNKKYPDIALAIGWILVATAVLMLPGFAFHGIYMHKNQDGFYNKFKESFEPLKDEWGPLNTQNRQRWLEIVQSSGDHERPRRISRVHAAIRNATARLQKPNDFQTCDLKSETSSKYCETSI